MEQQKEFKTVCPNCEKEVIVASITDFGMSFQVGPAKCQCGWEQQGKWLKNGFVADNPIGYCNLRNM